MHRTGRFPHRMQQLGGIDGFQEHGGCPKLARRSEPGADRGHGDDRRPRRRPLPEPLDELQAIEDGHHQVGDDHLRVQAFGHLETFLSVVGDGHLQPLVLKRRLRDLGEVAVVLDKEDEQVSGRLGVHRYNERCVGAGHPATDVRTVLRPHDRRLDVRLYLSPSASRPCSPVDSWRLPAGTSSRRALAWTPAHRATNATAQPFVSRTRFREQGMIEAPNEGTSAQPLVLVVDDFQDNREMYAEYLAYCGFRVIEAKNGKEAIEQAFAQSPNVIIMDLSLPVMDGWEATRRLKADGRTRGIPVIALTGHAPQGHSKGALDAGCDAFGAKPCLPDQLVLEIKRMLGTSASAPVKG